MITITLAMVLAMMSALDARADRNPAARHVAEAIVRTVDERTPIYGQAQTDASVLVVMSYRETRWMPMRNGDGNRALCEFQLQNAPIRVMWDIDLCTHIAYERLRWSAQTCPDAPLAWYAGGSCGNRTARRISDSRMKEAARIEALVGGDWVEFASTTTTGADP